MTPEKRIGPRGDRLDTYDGLFEHSAKLAAELGQKIGELAASQERERVLREDRERLDWLEYESGFPTILDCWASHPQYEVKTSGKFLGAGDTLREAIDAARAALSQQTAKEQR